MTITDASIKALVVYALGAAISFAVAGLIKVIDKMIRAAERRSKDPR